MPLFKEQIEDKLVTWMQRMNLLHWIINIDWNEEPEPREGEVAIAEIFAQMLPYDRTIIRLNKKVLTEWEEDAWGDHDPMSADYVLCHELIHVMMRDIDRISDEHVSEFLQRDAELLREKIYLDAREQFADQMARVILDGWGKA